MFKRITNPMVRGLLEWLAAIGFAVVLVFVVRNFLFRMAHVDGNSMSPTLSDGDMVVLNRFSYVFSSPRAGDIVAFPNPNNPSEHFIKRVIGMPGDTIDLREGVFYLNAVPLDDDFSRDVVFALGDMVFPVTMPEGLYFVLGDNRNGSMDSRFTSVGMIEGRDMIGRAVLRIWPLGSFGRVR